MPRLSLLKKSSYIKPKDVGKEGLMLTIARVQGGEFTDRQTGKTTKTNELTFIETEMRLTLNNANIDALAALFGDIMVETLPGKQVHVIRVKAMVYGEMKWVVRIEPPDDLEEDADDDGLREPLPEDEIPF